MKIEKVIHLVQDPLSNYSGDIMVSLTGKHIRTNKDGGWGIKKSAISHL